MLTIYMRVNKANFSCPKDSLTLCSQKTEVKISVAYCSQVPPIKTLEEEFLVEMTSLITGM